jgi:hypothetical protein
MFGGEIEKLRHRIFPALHALFGKAAQHVDADVLEACIPCSLEGGQVLFDGVMSVAVALQLLVEGLDAKADPVDPSFSHHIELLASGARVGEYLDRELALFWRLEGPH